MSALGLTGPSVRHMRPPSEIRMLVQDLPPVAAILYTVVQEDATLVYILSTPSAAAGPAEETGPKGKAPSTSPGTGAR